MIWRPLLWGGPVATALLGPALFWRGGSLEREAIAFVRHYMSDRPFLQKVFDPYLNDLGTYQARELSYFVDFLDAHVHAGLSAAGYAFFIPFSALVSSLLIAIVFLAGARRTASHVDALTASLLLMCLLTSFPFISTMGVFYRSGKPLLAVVLLALLFHVRSAEQQRSRGIGPGARVFGRDGAITFALLLVAGLLDRQGVFYGLVACGLLILHYRISGHLRDLLIAAAAAGLVLQLYDFVLAPLAVLALNGYWPALDYQLIPLSEALRPQIHVSRAIRLIVENVALLLGGLPLVLLALTALGVVLAWRRVGRATGSRGLGAVGRRLRLRDPIGRAVIYGLLGLAAQVAMFALMIARHGYVYRWVDHRYWYYPIPFLATVLFGLLVALDLAMPRVPVRLRRLVPVALALVAISNVLTLDYYRALMRSGPWFGPVSTQSELLKASLRQGKPDPGLDPEYLSFFDYHRGLRARDGFFGLASGEGASW
jgi:hypothetical protein